MFNKECCDKYNNIKKNKSHEQIRDWQLLKHEILKKNGPGHKTCEHGLYLYSNSNKSDNLTLRRHEFTISYDIDVNKTKKSDRIP